MNLEKIALKATKWIGSTTSLIIHTVLFIFSFILYFFGINLEQILLVLTTIVSLEAIYLSIFIQMTMNIQTEHLKEVNKDMEEIYEDIEEIEKDIEEIEKDVEELQEE